MSARLNISSVGLYLNSTKEHSESRDVIYECKVFNISMLSVSMFVLTVTAVAGCVSYFIRWRHRNQAGEYERTVTCNLEEEPVSLKVMQRSQSLHKPMHRFRAPEPVRKDDALAYYICTNSPSVGWHDDDNDVHPTLTPTHLEDGIILDPRTFYTKM